MAALLGQSEGNTIFFRSYYWYYCLVFFYSTHAAIQGCAVHIEQLRRLA